jgi:MerR family transcriptional regulator, light-induced transcriptional regulator
MQQTQNGRYRIKNAAARTGISTATLRAWERRYGLVQPKRSEGGYRLYSDEDIRLLQDVRAMIEKGFSVGEAIANIEERRTAAARAIWTPDRVADVRTQMLQALLAFDEAQADRLADRLASLHEERRVDEVYMPLLQTIGECWEHGQASISQEHFASGVVRRWLLEMLRGAGAQPRRGAEVLLAGLPGDQHDLALLGVAVLLGVHGHRVLYLGADVPGTDLRRLLEERRPALLCSSITAAQDVGSCLAIGRRLRELTPAGTAVVIGGRGVPDGLHGEVEPGLHFTRSVADALALLPAGAAHA